MEYAQNPNHRVGKKTIKMPEELEEITNKMGNLKVTKELVEKHIDHAIALSKGKATYTNVKALAKELVKMNLNAGIN